MSKQRVPQKRTRKKPPQEQILPAPVNDHDALVRGLWSIGAFVHKQLHYGLPESLRNFCLNLQWIWSRETCYTCFCDGSASTFSDEPNYRNPNLFTF